MQLTHFDRWLREKFVYQTHILTLRPPTSLPKGIRAVTQSSAGDSRYKFLFIPKNGKASDQLIRQLKHDGQMYMIRVVNRDAWFVPFLAPKGKSPTWWLISTTVIAAGVIYVLYLLKGLAEDPVFRKHFMEALDTLKS